MGKAGVWFRGAKGKTADMVFYKGKGSTLQRMRVDPKNPQTNLQMAQRIIFATVAQARKYMSEIIDHSFETVQAGEESLKYFSKINLRKLRAGAAVDFAESPSANDANVFMTTKGISQLIPNRYIISEGSIKNLSNISVDNNAGMSRYTFVNDVTLPVRTSGSSYACSKAELMAAFFGMTSVRDQITFCNIFLDYNSVLYAYDGQQDVNGFVIRPTTFEANRLVPKADAFEGNFTWPSDGSFISMITVAGELEKFFDMAKTSQLAINMLRAMFQGCSSTLNDSKVTISPTASTPTEIDSIYGNAYEPIGGGVIFSRMVGKAWRRSTCALQLIQMSAQYNWGLDWNTAIPAWFEDRAIAENNRILQQGEEGGSFG